MPSSVPAALAGWPRAWGEVGWDLLVGWGTVGIGDDGVVVAGAATVPARSGYPG